MLFALVALTCFILSFVGPDKVREGFGGPWSKAARCGDMAFGIWPLVIVCALESTSSSPVVRWLGLRIEWISRISWHRLFAFLVYALTTLHVILWTVQFARDVIKGELAWYVVYSYPNLRVGCAAYAAFTLLMFGGSDRLRKRHYEVFYASHILLVLLTLVLSIAHHPALGLWLGLPTMLWALERLVRYARRVRHGAVRLSRNQQFTQETVPLSPAAFDERTTWTAHARLMPSEVIRLHIRVPIGFRWAPAQTILLSIPKLSAWQSHPFTIANNYNDVYADEVQELVVLIKARNGLTRRLLILLRDVQKRSLRWRVDDDGGPMDNILVEGGPQFTRRLEIEAVAEGPFGASRNLDLDSYSTILCVVGGVGISMGASIFEYACQRLAQQPYLQRRGKSRLIRLRFVWLVRSYAEIAWMASPLFQAHSTVKDDTAQVEIYVTRPAALPPTAELEATGRRLYYSDLVDEYHEEQRRTQEEEANPLDNMTDFDGRQVTNSQAEEQLAQTIRKEGMIRRATTRLKKREAQASPAQLQLPSQALSAAGAWGTNRGSSPRSDPSAYSTKVPSISQTLSKSSTSVIPGRQSFDTRPASDYVVPLVSGDDTAWVHDADYQAMLVLSEVAQTGRPPLQSIIQQELVMADSNLMVFCGSFPLAGCQTDCLGCGPPALDRSIRDEVASARTSARTKDKGIRIDLYAETLL